MKQPSKLMQDDNLQNTKRREIEDKFIELIEKSPQKAIEYMRSVTPEYMNAISKDITNAIGTYSNPWIVAGLELYADALRKQMSDTGVQMIDKIKKAGKIAIVHKNML